MTPFDEMLKRTTLKYFGTYLSSGNSINDRGDEDEDALVDRELERLTRLLDSACLDKALYHDILEAAHAYGEVNHRVGFLTGLKAGARTLLQLIDGADIVY